MSGEDLKKDSADTVGHEESFAALLEKSGGMTERLAPGQKVRARVVSISGEYVYIDIGGKSEGAIDAREFAGEDGGPEVNEGDEIEAYFVSVKDGVRILTTMINGYPAVTLTAIRDAFEAGLPVNGEVRREVKGGFEVSVGGVRSFCPFSQIDLRGGREGGVYLGQVFSFKVLEYEEDGKNIIVSRRTLLEQEKQVRIERLKETLEVGMDITARVSSIRNFGAFVDLGGIEGLIPSSEVTWDRNERHKDILSEGQDVTARIISLDWDKNRLTLSIKATQPDPWAAAVSKYPVDGRVNGTIVRLAPFGAFVNLEPGIDGLIHISNLGAGRRINHPKEAVEVGQWVETYVLAVDPEKRKLSLSLQPRPRPEKIVLPPVGELIEGTVEKVMPYGVFIKMGDGLAGLIPNSEMGTQTGADHRRMFQPGTEMQAIVTEVDTASNKVSLSRKAVIERASRQEYDEYINSLRQPEAPSGGLGSIGEMLKARMEERK